MKDVIIPTTAEVLSMMEAELYKTRSIVLTLADNRSAIIRIDTIVSYTPTLRNDYQSWLNVLGSEESVAVRESVPEILSRIARVEKDRM
jgi:hypothetical protein